MNFTGQFLWQQLQQQCCLININDAPECLFFFSFPPLTISRELLICYRRLFRVDFNRTSPTGAVGLFCRCNDMKPPTESRKEKRNIFLFLSAPLSHQQFSAAILLALGLLDICPSAAAPVSVQYTARCCCCCSYYYSTLPIKNPRESHQLVRPNSLGSELRHKWRSVGYIDNMYVYIYLSFLSFLFFILHPGERRRRRGRKRFSFPLAFPSV